MTFSRTTVGRFRFCGEELPFDTDESESHVFGPQQPVEYWQENVEVLLWPNMVRQMMHPPCIRHPSSVVYSQVNLYPHQDVG